MSDTPMSGAEHWEQTYRDADPASHPWYLKDLDPDVAAALDELDPPPSSVLDLGSGPGTQAMCLAERGYDVTASDVSPTAVRQAEAEARRRGLAIRWLQDDILETRLKGPFDLVLDRGCFHVIPPESRGVYLSHVRGLIRDGGHLLMICFSHREPPGPGPHRFTPDEIRSLFAERFIVESINEAQAHSDTWGIRQTLFTVMRARP